MRPAGVETALLRSNAKHCLQRLEPLSETVGFLRLRKRRRCEGHHVGRHLHIFQNAAIIVLGLASRADQAVRSNRWRKGH